MKRLTLLLALSAGVSLDSHAQLGDFFKSVASDAARQVVSGQVTRAVNGAVDSAVKGMTQPNGAAAPAAEAGAQPAAAPAAAGTPAGCPRIRKTPIVAGARPESYQPETLWPDPGCPVANYADWKFEKATAAKHAFREASKVRCKDCEGGYWPDAWGWRDLVKNSSDYGRDFTKLLIALKEGESLTWKGNKYDGKVTALGAHPIGELPCRQFRYTLTEKGRQIAEYDSLYCEYIGGYASKASWHEML